MALRKRKAALLLMSLEPATAAELLKSAEPEMITLIAAELAYLDASGYDISGDDSPIREFSDVLNSGGDQAGGGAFLKKMIEGAVGSQKSLDVLADVDRMVQMRDPFKSVRMRSAEKIASALKGESAQVAAMVLSELPAKKSAALLPMLDDGIRNEAVGGMAASANVSPEAKLRVAAAVENRLMNIEQLEAKGTGPVEVTDKGKDEQLRKIALLLRGLKVEFRDELMEGIVERDQETAKTVQRLMVMWEDLFAVPERSLQEALRTSDSRQLALALVGSDQATMDRIRSNISERASTMLDEETALLSNPKDEDIQNAREAILDALRTMNENGELEFEEKE